jgi:hypothetical protein
MCVSAVAISSYELRSRVGSSGRKAGSPASTESRGLLYRELVSEYRYEVILDNAAKTIAAEVIVGVGGI